MIFYEATNFGLRVVTFQMVNPEDKKVKIRLLPMVHIGSKKYYQEVEKYLEISDIILFEGNSFKSWKVKINNNERTAKKLNLVTQLKELNLSQYKHKLINADYDQKSGAKSWKNLSFLDKLKYNVIFPIWIYFQDRNLTRLKFAKYFMRSIQDQELIYGPFMDNKEKIKKFVHENRDKRVFEELEKLLQKEFSKETQIAVVYGAGHMKSISRYLMDKKNYKSLNAEFIEVFKI